MCIFYYLITKKIFKLKTLGFSGLFSCGDLTIDMV